MYEYAIKVDGNTIHTIALDRLPLKRDVNRIKGNVVDWYKGAHLRPDMIELVPMDENSPHYNFIHLMLKRSTITKFLCGVAFFLIGAFVIPIAIDKELHRIEAVEEYNAQWRAK